MERRSVDSRSADQLLGLVRRRARVVDDDLEDLLYYSAVLQHQGYEVCSIPLYKDDRSKDIGAQYK